jgi:Tol biopolymer transport system component
MNADGTEQVRLTSAGTDDGPTWSPDGRRIAFGRQFGYNPATSELAVMNADGSDIRVITHNRVSDVAPIWSPDGRWLAFDRQVRSRLCCYPDVFLIRPDGTRPRMLVRGGFSASWQPRPH